MEIIPVIDLKGGVVVRARAGDRASYRPIKTTLSPTSNPVDVVSGLLALHPFGTLYVADLDAIMGRATQHDVVKAVSERFPALELWVDNGCSDRNAAERLLADLETASLVLGSESQKDAALVSVLRDHARVLLSLDFRGDQFVGPPELLDAPLSWPNRIIVMTLARVGTNCGPDFSRYSRIRELSRGRRVYLAGGLRGRDDLAAVKASGAAGILVASALHDGRLAAEDLQPWEDSRQ
jgi:phosphoribosylformimino-5-aminoimidazole carboxamide ribotide isomerase